VFISKREASSRGGQAADTAGTFGLLPRTEQGQILSSVLEKRKGACRILFRGLWAN